MEELNNVCLYSGKVFCYLDSWEGDDSLVQETWPFRYFQKSFQKMCFSCDIGKHKSHFLGCPWTWNYNKCDKNTIIFDSAWSLSPGTVSLTALRDFSVCSTVRIQTIWVNNFSCHVTALFSPMGCWGIVLQVIWYFVFHFKLSFVQRACFISLATPQLDSALEKNKPQNYLSVIKIVHAGSPLPHTFKWSVLQGQYSPGVNYNTFLTATGNFCSNWSWFICVSKPWMPIHTVYALSLRLAQLRERLDCLDWKTLDVSTRERYQCSEHVPGLFGWSESTGEGRNN